MWDPKGGVSGVPNPNLSSFFLEGNGIGNPTPFIPFLIVVDRSMVKRDYI